jgi:hypothetical protein
LQSKFFSRQNFSKIPKKWAGKKLLSKGSPKGLDDFWSFLIKFSAINSNQNYPKNKTFLFLIDAFVWQLYRYFHALSDADAF